MEGTVNVEKINLWGGGGKEMRGAGGSLRGKRVSSLCDIIVYD